MACECVEGLGEEGLVIGPDMLFGSSLRLLDGLAGGTLRSCGLDGVDEGKRDGERFVDEFGILSRKSLGLDGI